MPYVLVWNRSGIEAKLKRLAQHISGLEEHSFGGVLGPGTRAAAAPSGNIRQIVQTASDVMIWTELDSASSASFPPMAVPEEAPATRSTGRWEGDALVVRDNGHHRTVLAAHADRCSWSTPKTLITERFTRTAADEITYTFRVDDASLYTQPWRGETVMKRSSERMYEFACHEGNYGLANIPQRLSRGRAARREGAAGETLRECDDARCNASRDPGARSPRPRWRRSRSSIQSSSPHGREPRLQVQRARRGDRRGASATRTHDEPAITSRSPNSFALDGYRVSGASASKLTAETFKGVDIFAIVNAEAEFDGCRSRHALRDWVKAGGSLPAHRRPRTLGAFTESLAGRFRRRAWARAGPMTARRRGRITTQLTYSRTNKLLAGDASDPRRAQRIGARVGHV